MALPRLRVRFRAAELPRVPRIAALEPGGMLGMRTSPALVALEWEAATRRAIAEAAIRSRRQRLLAALGLQPATLAERRRRRRDIPPPEAIAAPELTASPTSRALRSMQQYADLGIDLAARMEVRFDRRRSERCTVLELNDPASGCDAGFPTPSLEQEIRLRAGGVASDRVHVNVDFDSEREFSANNNINVFYAGLEDEVLRRIEVGNVSFPTPSSRFITATVPANSFGIQALGQVGPLDIGAILAQQKGSAIRVREFTVGQTTTQPVDYEIRDLDYEQARFFFVIGPRDLPGYPAVDVLNIARDALPPALQIAQVRVYRLRAQSGQAGSNPNLGGIEAVAIRRDSPQRVGPFSWELLVEGQDYYLDPSATWFALPSRLGEEDFLAVSYVTVAGDTVGTFPAANGVLDTLELIHEPRRGPEAPTFVHELRNWYRVAGRDVDRSTLDLTIRVGTSEAPLDQQGTYLSRLGLALATDALALDEFNRVFPRQRDPGLGAPVRELYVVFPHLFPFADSSRLEESERNDSLYRMPDYLLRTQGPAPRLLLQVRYEATGAGDRSTLSLGSIQVRAGSERIYLADRALVKGRDYEIDYGLGQVNFLNPDALFPTASRVKVEFEENQLFDQAPKTMFGLATTYRLTGVGTVSALGIYQRERTIDTRPTLGFEPQAGFIGGLSTDLSFRSEGLTRALDRLPLIRTNVPSALTVNGEVAVSLPNANRTGAAYVEDFERESAVPLPLSERAFQLGSAPSSGLGLPAGHLGLGGLFDRRDVAPLVWQNLVQFGTDVLRFEPQDIDTAIALAGRGVVTETVLWLTLKPDTIGGLPDPVTGQPRWVLPHTAGPRWRSITQALGRGSGVGVDLSRTEFLEFWVLEDALRTARAEDAYLVFDFGRVFEDAVAVAPDTLRVQGADTTFSGLQFVGQGRLDTEKDSLTNVFNARVDDRGIHGDRPDSLVDGGTGAVLESLPLCDLQGLTGLTAFPLGDLAARCTRGNGSVDTEDLDGDNRLDAEVGTVEEDFVRYLFPIGSEQHYVRDGNSLADASGRTLTWRLYRIPFRADTLRVGRPDPRRVEAVRITMVAPDRGGPGEEVWVALARVQLTGAAWLKRAPRPIAGISGSQEAPHGEVVASTVTTENADLGYEPPPGVGDLPERADLGLGLGAVQINEKSLRVLATDLRGGERAEAFVRFTGGADRNFLNYRTLRVWARGRGAGWTDGDLEFFIKVGRDEHNFYLYRGPLRTDTWEPEIVVDLERWLGLRAQVEAAWLGGAPPGGAAQCGGDETAYVACDGPYVVHVRDPGTAPPNLAQVSEVSAGMFRQRETVAIDEAELWVDDIRLTGMVDDVGTAAALDVRLAAADLADFGFAFTRRDDRFRQLGEDATYVTDASTRFGGTLRLEKLLPGSWGLTMPLVVQHSSSSSDPYYINRTDVRADALTSLRRPEGSVTGLQFTIRRVRRGQSFVTRTLLDPLSAFVSRETASNTTSLSRSSAENRLYRLQYASIPGARTVGAAPGFLVSLVDALPAWIRNSEFGKALRRARLRWNPARLSFSSTLTNNVAERLVYRVPVEVAADSVIRPLASIVHMWRNEAGLELRPFESLSLRADLASTRDLQHYGDSTTSGRLLILERRQLFGRDVGFERFRTMTASINVAPVISSWFRPRIVVATWFTFSRDPNRRDVVSVAEDSAGTYRLPETIGNSRRSELGAGVDLARLARGISGDSRLVERLFNGILPADASYTRELRSGFDRVPFSADIGYQLGLGGLDAFLTQDGVPATSAGDTRTLLVSGGWRLPLGLQVRMTYRSLENTAWQRRGDAQAEVRQVNREWPSVNLSWNFAPPRALRRVLTSATAQAQYRVQETSRTQPPFGTTGVGDVTAVRTENNSRQLSPTLTLTWGPGVTTSARLSLSESEATTAGNVTESERRDWGASATYAFRLPRSLVALPGRIQSTLSFASSLLAVCIVPTGTEGCRSVSDSRRQQVDLRMDTGFSASVRGGLAFSHIVTEQRHLSQKISQIVFSIFGNLTLAAGRIR